MKEHKAIAPSGAWRKATQMPDGRWERMDGTAHTDTIVVTNNHYLTPASNEFEAASWVFAILPEPQTFTATGDGEITVETGGQPVVIDKLFGPACVCRVKIVLDLAACQWAVFREVDTKPDDNDQPSVAWVEVARFTAST